MIESRELLEEYACGQSEAAFGELVSRHIDFVYSSALRMVGGDRHLAEDIAQGVFIDLARKASSLRSQRSLEGWLYQATRFAAAKAVRAERRRAAREREAVLMESLSSNAEADWGRIAPILDEALGELGAKDREAVVLRFFARKNLRAIAEAAGTTEEAARKRVARALEKLRGHLGRRGLSLSEGALAAALGVGTVAVAPPGFAAAITTAALAAPAAIGGVATLLSFMATAKIKLAVAGLGLGLVAIPLVIQQQSISKLRAENKSLEEQLAQARNAPPPLEMVSPERERLRREEQAELLRLRGEVTALRREKAEFAQSQIKPKTAGENGRPAFVEWLEGVLSGPANVMGSESGNVRRKFMNHEQLNEGEQGLLINMVRRSAEVEKSPENFSNFQSAFVSSLLGWSNDPRSERVKEVIHAAATQANEQQMDFHAPTENADCWSLEQKELNRTATSAVQALLLGEERAVFDRAFLGVMGIDFGVSISSGGPNGRDDRRFSKVVWGPQELRLNCRFLSKSAAAFFPIDFRPYALIW